jgi:hypothetical protein
MPWQGDLFIGEPVKDEDEAFAIYRALGIKFDEDSIFDGGGKDFHVTLRGRTIRVYVYAMVDSESCEKAVAFNLTSRYRGSVLDVDCKHEDGRPSGRSDPFVFDPQDLLDLLAQVRTWWPNAKTFIWDRHH